ncbi:MAG TPA: phosphoribosylformylglycinamidine synthase subunit PurS [Acidimicrobiales bacterium]
MIFSVLVETRLRPGVADPQGATIERSLPHLGFEGISGVRVGKAFRFDLEAPDDATATAHADEVTRRFLINPVIEDADISVTATEPA